MSDEKVTEITLGEEDFVCSETTHSGNAEMVYEGKHYEIEYSVIVVEESENCVPVSRAFTYLMIHDENEKEVEEPLRQELIEAFEDGYDGADSDGFTPD